MSGGVMPLADKKSCRGKTAASFLLIFGAAMLASCEEPEFLKEQRKLIAYFDVSGETIAYRTHGVGVTSGRVFVRNQSDPEAVKAELQIDNPTAGPNFDDAGDFLVATYTRGDAVSAILKCRVRDLNCDNFASVPGRISALVITEIGLYAVVAPVVPRGEISEKYFGAKFVRVNADGSSESLDGETFVIVGFPVRLPEIGWIADLVIYGRPKPKFSFGTRSRLNFSKNAYDLTEIETDGQICEMDEVSYAVDLPEVIIQSGGNIGEIDGSPLCIRRKGGVTEVFKSKSKVFQIRSGKIIYPSDTHVWESVDISAD